MNRTGDGVVNQCYARIPLAVLLIIRGDQKRRLIVVGYMVHSHLLSIGAYCLFNLDQLAGGDPPPVLPCPRCAEADGARQSARARASPAPGVELRLRLLAACQWFQA